MQRQGVPAGTRTNKAGAELCRSHQRNGERVRCRPRRRTRPGAHDQTVGTLGGRPGGGVPRDGANVTPGRGRLGKVTSISASRISMGSTADATRQCCLHNMISSVLGRFSPISAMDAAAIGDGMPTLHRLFLALRALPTLIGCGAEAVGAKILRGCCDHPRQGVRPAGLKFDSSQACRRHSPPVGHSTGCDWPCRARHALRLAGNGPGDRARGL